MRRLLFISAVGAAGAMLAGCMPAVDYSGFETSSVGAKPLAVARALDCPETQGALTRTDQAADGASCLYAGPDEEVVRLSLVAVAKDGPAEALEPLRAALHRELPIRTPHVRPVDRNEPEQTRIDLPFFHVHAAGDHAEVRMFGIKVHSEGKDADVDLSRGSKHTIVHAGRDGAEVVVEDVGRVNAELVYVLAANRDGAPAAEPAVGYVAKGPVKGPLVVAEFHAHHGSRVGEHHPGGDDIGKLIDRNLKG